jgi:hypothetical protein
MMTTAAVMAGDGAAAITVDDGAAAIMAGGAAAVTADDAAGANTGIGMRSASRLHSDGCASRIF